MNLWPCKNCIKTQERENRRDLYTPVLSLFNYHTKIKCKCSYQFLINITLSISIRKISEVLKQRQFKWELSDTMADYANDHLNIFIQEKDLKGSILKTIPVPSNLQEVRRMDEFMVRLLKEKRQNILHHQNAIHEKIQRKAWTLWGHCVSYGKV